MILKLKAVFCSMSFIKLTIIDVIFTHKYIYTRQTLHSKNDKNVVIVDISCLPCVTSSCIHDICISEVFLMVNIFLILLYIFVEIKSMLFWKIYFVIVLWSSSQYS